MSWVRRRPTIRCKIAGPDGACCDACASGADVCPCEAEAGSSSYAAPEDDSEGKMEVIGDEMQVPVYATTGMEPSYEPTSPTDAGLVYDMRVRTFRKTDPKTGDVAWIAAGTLNGPLGKSELYAKVDERQLREIYGIGRELARRLARRHAVRELLSKAEGVCAGDCERMMQETSNGSMPMTGGQGPYG